MPERDPLSELPWPEPVEPRLTTSQTIRRECLKDLCPRRGASGHKRVLLSMAISGVVVAALTILAIRYRPETSLRAALYGALGWALVQAAVLFFGLARPPGRRGSALLRLGVAVSVPVLFLVYLAFASAHHTGVGEFFSAERAGHTAGCGFVALLFGAVVAAGMLLVWRGTDPLTPRLSGALAGLAGGLGGAIAIGLACPSAEAWHLWLAHGSIVLVLMAIGGLVGRRWLAP